MKNTFRLLTMAGMGLVAGVAFGSGPAQAAEATPQPVAKKVAPQSSQAEARHNRSWVAGYYRSGRQCEFAGRIGERFNKWDDFDCDPIRFGLHRGTWVLRVEQDWNWNRPGFGGRPFFNGDHRPGFGQRDRFDGRDRFDHRGNGFDRDRSNDHQDRDYKDRDHNETKR
jgi:hypothetical protein